MTFTLNMILDDFLGYYVLDVETVRKVTVSLGDEDELIAQDFETHAITVLEGSTQAIPAITFFRYDRAVRCRENHYYGYV